MKPFTTLSKTDVLEILQPYDLLPILHFKSLSGGSENSNYLIQNNEDHFVLTIFEKMTVHKTSTLASLLQHLSDHQFRTNEVQSTVDGSNISSFQDKPVLVKRFIKGKIPNKLAHNQLVDLGQKIAALHTIPCPDDLPNNITYGQDKFHNLYEWQPNHPFAKWLSRKEDFLSPYLDAELPTSLIHADIFTNNLVIDSNNDIIIFDFEEACLFFRIFDLGMTIVGACCPDGRLSIHQARLMLQGYQQKIQLTSIEKEILIPMAIYAATATAYWRFMQFNLLQPERGLQKHYQGMQQIADQLFELKENLLE